jgi:hypothetical protein
LRSFNSSRTGIGSGITSFPMRLRRSERSERNMPTREQLVGFQDGKLDAGFLRLPVPQGN